MNVAFDRAAHRELYPFESHYLKLPGARMHYLDEGPRRAAPMVMVHGNPTWSLYYRELVRAFRGDHRVIVPDHVGMGLSDKPDDAHYPYRLARRVEDLESLLDALGAEKDVTLVLHDWGGMIGMAWATRHVERVKRLVLLNTAAFGLPPGKSFPWPLWMARDTPVSALLVRGLNAFARVASHVGASSRKLPRELRDAYCAPYDSWANRIATLRFVEDIPLSPSHPSHAVVKEVEDNLTANFGQLPALICWGAKDFVFDDHFLDAWKRFLPRAEVHRFADSGHYVLEDAGERIVPLMTSWIEKNP